MDLLVLLVKHMDFFLTSHQAQCKTNSFPNSPPPTLSLRESLNRGDRSRWAPYCRQSEAGHCVPGWHSGWTSLALPLCVAGTSELCHSGMFRHTFVSVAADMGRGRGFDKQTDMIKTQLHLNLGNATRQRIHDVLSSSWTNYISKALKTPLMLGLQASS